MSTLRLFSVVLLASLASCFSAEIDLGRDAVASSAKLGIALLDKLYWSPTLNIWLDQPGDDIRAYYDGRRNPPWWSSANAVEMLLDYMRKTGSAEYEATIAALYDSNKDLRQKSPRVIAELKRRNQWSAVDEERFQKKQAATQPVLNNYYTEFRNEYLDDSGWWGITWLKMYDRTRDKKYLATAQAVHAHMARNWRPEKNGGVMWTEVEDKLVPNAIT
ncbi:MAG: glycosyl hydrolase, family 76, partial [Chthoniobacteraceae bacterium]|nr:glycosyl hydrolase, family 76 [Chthoniobacteraceae bacterium]